MKKITLAFFAFILFFNCSTVLPVKVNTKTYSIDYSNLFLENREDEILTGFMNMQNEITNSLSLKDGKYVYNEEVIKEIVNAYDFTEYNKKFNSSWTKQSFFDLAMKNIKEFEDVKKMNGSCPIDTNGSVRATMCGQNWESSGWNYVRVARDKNGANKLANEMEDAAALCGVMGVAGAATVISVPALAAIMGVASGISQAYFNSYARWIRYNNDLTSCGIVTDQNKFTAVFDIWTQPEFANR